MYELFIGSFVLFVSMLILLYFFKIKRSKFASKYIVTAIIITIFLNINYGKFNDGSFLIIKASINSLFNKNENIKNNSSNSQHNISTKSPDLNIVFVIGESMRAKEFHQKEYSIFSKYNYKTIYSGGTATDVSIPLLLNGGIKPQNIDINNNIFKLAKQNNFKTTFASIQSKKSLKYINRYLNSSYIDKLNIIGSYDDNDISKILKQIDKTKSNLIVFQMQGQHSPYKSYPNYKKSTIPIQYTKTMEYSNKVLTDTIEYIKSIKKPSIFIFTSDHGELIGLNENRYGHNAFKQEIYKVPLLIYTNFKSENYMKNISSHNDIYRLIKKLLGYQVATKISEEIIINGTMISGEDGFISVD